MADERAAGERAAGERVVVGFDLDMTLVDSAKGIVATLAAAVAHLRSTDERSTDARSTGERSTGERSTGERSTGERGTDEPGISAAEVWPWIGLPLEGTVQALAPDLEPAAVIREYRARYATLALPLTSLLPGAWQAVRAVRAAGGRVLVVSAKAEAGVHEVLTAVGLDDPQTRPDLVVGDLFAAAKGRRLLAEGAHVYVGDHPADVEAARVAGAVSVAVVTGPQPEAALVAAGADVVLKDLTAFPGWLASYLS